MGVRWENELESTAASLKDEGIGGQGRELRINSALRNYKTLRRLITRLPWLEVDFTPASQMWISPKCGEYDGMKFQLILSDTRRLRNEFSFPMRNSSSWCNSECAPTRLVPLSDDIFLGRPRYATNLRMASMKSSVMRSETNSKCMALVVN